MESRWVCAQTRSLLEAKALQNVRRQQYKCFFPYFIKHTKKLKPAVRPLFPGYIFIKIEEDQPWSPLNSTYGILHVLTRHEDCGMVPHKIPEQFINSMSRLIIAEKKLPGHEMPQGTRVRVLRGALENQEAIVEWHADKRVGLLFDILGRNVEVEFYEKDLVRL